MVQNKTEYIKPRQLQVSTEQAGRRIDNYLSTKLKGLPKSRIYQMLRKGEVRVNSARIKQDYRLQAGDKVRIPPVFINEEKNSQHVPQHIYRLLDNSILYEDDHMLVLNKPAGISVHGGSKQKFGIIETLRKQRPEIECIELVHRLDKETSGCLIIAKDHRFLRTLNEYLKSGKIEKNYLALLKNRLKRKYMNISSPLKKNTLKGNERLVRVDPEGKQAVTRFILKKNYNNMSLVNIDLKTGRTHQIRVHAAELGHPVAGDSKYGDHNFNKRMRKSGLKRLFLHAETIKFKHPVSGKQVKISAPMPDDLSEVINKL